MNEEPNTTAITRKLVSDDRRVDHTAELFGVHFPMQLEPFVYSIAAKLSADYHGAYWKFHALSNGGFYMSLASERIFNVIGQNGFNGPLSSDALGITACLYPTAICRSAWAPLPRPAGGSITYCASSRCSTPRSRLFWGHRLTLPGRPGDALRFPKVPQNRNALAAKCRPNAARCEELTVSLQGRRISQPGPSCPTATLRIFLG